MQKELQTRGDQVISSAAMAVTPTQPVGTALPPEATYDSDAGEFLALPQGDGAEVDSETDGSSLFVVDSGESVLSSQPLCGTPSSPPPSPTAATDSPLSPAPPPLPTHPAPPPLSSTPPYPTDINYPLGQDPNTPWRIAATALFVQELNRKYVKPPRVQRSAKTTPRPPQPTNPSGHSRGSSSIPNLLPTPSSLSSSAPIPSPISHPHPSSPSYLPLPSHSHLLPFPPLLLYMHQMHALLHRLQVYVSMFIFPLSRPSTLGEPV